MEFFNCPTSRITFASCLFDDSPRNEWLCVGVSDIYIMIRLCLRFYFSYPRHFSWKKTSRIQMKIFKRLLFDSSNRERASGSFDLTNALQYFLKEIKSYLKIWLNKEQNAFYIYCFNVRKYKTRLRINGSSNLDNPHIFFLNWIVSPCIRKPYYFLFQQRFVNMHNSLVVRCRTGDQEVPALNPARCEFSAFGDFFSFARLFHKKAETKAYIWASSRENLSSVFTNK